jgi:hypothetical protein
MAWELFGAVISDRICQNISLELSQKSQVSANQLSTRAAENRDPDLAGMEKGSLSSMYLRKRGLIDYMGERNYVSRDKSVPNTSVVVGTARKL